jgi:hypothetical protein
MSVMEEDEEMNNEEDPNDVVNKFVDGLRYGRITFYITADAFNKMCNMNLKNKDMEYVDINQMVYWAYGEIQLVMRDVLELVKDKKYKPKTIIIGESGIEETVGGQFCGFFWFNKERYFVDSVKVGVDKFENTIYMSEER